MKFYICLWIRLLDDILKKTYIAAAGFVVAAIIGGILTLTAPGDIVSLVPAAIHYEKVIQVVLALVSGYIALRLLGSSIIYYGYQKRRMDERSVARVVSLLGYVVLLILILFIFKINLTGILVGAGFLGIVVGMASQSTLGNFFAGITMMAAKPFASGDKITFSTWQYGMLPPSYPHHAMLPGYSGVIENIGLMHTKLKLDDGTFIFVPNGIIIQAVIINYSISKVKDIVIRVELVKRDFDSFRKEIEKGVARNTRLKKMMNGEIEVVVTDIGISNYAVKVKATVPVEDEAYASTELMNLALHASERFQS